MLVDLPRINISQHVPKKPLIKPSTSVTFDKALLAQAKKAAKADHRTFSAWVNHVIREKFARQSLAAPAPVPAPVAPVTVEVAS